MKQLNRRGPIVGPLAHYVDGFVAFLLSEGYSPATVYNKYYLVQRLSRWMQRCKLPLARLKEEQLKQFQVDCLSRCRHWNGASTACQLLQYLRDLGSIPIPRQKTDRTPLGYLTHDFEEYLLEVRGLSGETATRYLKVARRFLTEQFGSGALRLADLCVRDIHRFIIRTLKDRSRSDTQKTVVALRSFLRFLKQREAIATDLAAALPGIANWRSAHLPRSLSPKQVRKILSSCDRSKPSGQRDYVILLLMARLGLRAGEVVNMTLDDLDWERGEIVVHGKGQIDARLPMPTDVGSALVRYLRHSRPTCSTRRVFVRTIAPYRGLARHGTISVIVWLAIKRAGVTVKFVGANLLRHSLATNLLRRGATLTEIGQLLRHNNLTTTQIYAKVDVVRLRTIALPWPRSAL